MRSFVLGATVLGGFLLATTATPAAQAPASGADVYHVHFTKAAPGQADALGKALMVPDKTAPMPDHFVVLRHQEGDDWDYAVIQHLGPKAEVTAAPGPPPPAGDLRSWHTDTFVSGPSWSDFTREMGLGGGSSAGGQVYILGVHRPVSGHVDQLQKALSGAGPEGSKIQTGAVLMRHLEGSEWMFLAITRYNSWQDFATDRAAAAAAPSGTGGWADIRQHSAFHRDTIADRIYPK
ncbi:MAG TPA: hypothetical protein VD833_10240 [Vicinamibacterales bacterium]|nr:hypothetical protein [Vicinamibacterales bacterium]